MDREKAWKKEMRNLFGESSEEDEAVSSAQKRMERTLIKEVRATKKFKSSRGSEDEAASAGIVDVMAFLSLMRIEIKENQKVMKKNMRKCAI